MGVEPAPAVMVDEIGDEAVGMGEARRALDLVVAGIELAVGDVVADRAVQQRGVLRHHADLGAQAVLRHPRDVLPVDQDAAAFEVVQAQQQRHDGRLAGPARAHEPDLLPRRHPQREVVENAAALLAVMEPHPLEADLAAIHHQRRGVRRVHQPVRLGDGAHRLLEHAHVLEHAAHRLHHPARHGDDAHHQRQPAGDEARAHRAVAPQHQRQPRRADDQDRVHHLQEHRRRREQPHHVEESAGVARDGVAHGGALRVGAREQLHRHHVGVAVDHAAGHGRARLRHFQRAIPGPRHEVAQQHAVSDDPEQHRQRQRQADRREQRQRRHREDADVEQRVEHRHRDFANRLPRLQDARRQPPGEVALEIRDRVAERVAVRAPADHVGGVDDDDLVLDYVVHEIERGPQHQHGKADDEQRRAVRLEDRRRIALGQHVDEPPDEQIERALEHPHRHRDEREDGEPALHRREIMPGERGHAPVRRRLVAIEGVEGIDTGLRPAVQGGAALGRLIGHRAGGSFEGSVGRPGGKNAAP